MRKFLVFLLSLLFCDLVFSQTVQLHFPYFSGKAYAFIAFQGNRSDTLSKGKLTDRGEAVLQMPKTYEHYAGMVRFLIKEKSGGGFDFIVNNENFAVECLEATPNQKNITYKGSPENSFLNKNLMLQYALIQKIIQQQQAGATVSPMFPALSATALYERRLDSLSQAVLKSNLYAAKYIQISNYTVGFSERLYSAEQQRLMALNRFVTDKLSWNVLYTSGLWDKVVYTWANQHLQVFRNDAALLADIRKITSQLPDNELYTNVVAKLVESLTEFGKDAVIAELAPEVKKSGRLVRKDGMLAVFAGVQKGDIAPVINGIGDATWGEKGTILVFFESACEHCDTLIHQLKGHFSALQSQKIKVISIASDISSEIYTPYAQQLPWKEKLCDFTGPIGVNFKKYTVIGTPTLIYIDSKGVVQGRFAKLDELLRLLPQN